ncbi:hypothetical protein GCM10018785_46330 [Streptomyces longispororuber]|uniref:Uncharacterized protein n=1 Tax=Streptomyces longispororuber TaxID=68230 RepID=A0A918ZW37_9ACTN|nr:hypothetical protein GCM10018785_46330 [Streptomyces longispororuber]
MDGLGGLGDCSVQAAYCFVGFHRHGSAAAAAPGLQQHVRQQWQPTGFILGLTDQPGSQVALNDQPRGLSWFDHGLA